jgi:hypothetical protein
VTTVRFPTRVRLDVTDDRLDDPATIELILDAAGSALHRTTERAHGVHLVRSSRPDPMREPQVSVRFTGDQLPAATTRQLSEGLAAMARTEAARLLARPANLPVAGQRPETAADTSGRGELYDRLRLVADWARTDGDYYLIPSYNGGGEPKKVPIEGQDPPAPGPVQTYMRMRFIKSKQELEAELAKRYGAAIPSPLVVASADARQRPQASLITVDATGKVDEPQKWLGEWSTWVPSKNEGQAQAQAWQFAQADRLRFVASGATADERRKIREAEYLRVIKERLGDDARIAKLSDDDLGNLAMQLVRQIPDPGNPIDYYNLMYGDTVVQMIETKAGALAHGDVPVAVFTEEVPVSGRGGPGGAGATSEQTGRTECPDLPLEELLWFTIDPEHPFLAEPPAESWPVYIAAQLTSLITDIAGRLDMAPGRFPGMFLMAACQKISTTAAGLGSQPGTGQVGADPRTIMLGKLAAAFDPMARLEILYTRVIAGADEGGILTCPLAGHSAGWLLHFYEQYFARRDVAVKTMFVATCQDVLLEILESSHSEIERRRNNFDAYMQVTRVLILLLLVDVTELTELRDLLTESSGVTWTGVAVVTAGGPIGVWYEAAKTLVTLLEKPPIDTSGPPQRGRIAQMSDGPRIQDSTGRWWSKAELDSVIGGGREQAFAVDPLLEKLSDLPEVVTRLRNAGATGVDAEFKSLLGDLKTENEAKTKDVREDNAIAFGLASMKAAEITSSSSIGAELAGIHAKADGRLRPLFTGCGADAYVAGLRSLVSSELGYESFSMFFNIVGITAIAILCPPAAFAIGAAQAVYGLNEAFEHRGIQKAMLGGDEILSKAQAEAEMWGAAIGAALVFIPEVPGLVRGARGGVKAVLAGEAREAASVAGRQAIRSAATQLAELAAKDLATVFVKECLKGYLLNLALQGAIGRITDAVAREVQVSGHASIADLPQLLSSAVSGPAPSPGGAQ